MSGGDPQRWLFSFGFSLEQSKPGMRKWCVRRVPLLVMMAVGTGPPPSAAEGGPEGVRAARDPAAVRHPAGGAGGAAAGRHPHPRGGGPFPSLDTPTSEVGACGWGRAAGFAGGFENSQGSG